MSICPYCRTRNDAAQAAPSGNPFGPAGFMICRNCRSRYPVAPARPDADNGDRPVGATAPGYGFPAQPAHAQAGQAGQAAPFLLSEPPGPGPGPVSGREARLQPIRTPSVWEGGVRPGRGDDAQPAQPCRTASGACAAVAQPAGDRERAGWATAGYAGQAGTTVPSGPAGQIGPAGQVGQAGRPAHPGPAGQESGGRGGSTAASGASAVAPGAAAPSPAPSPRSPGEAVPSSVASARSGHAASTATGAAFAPGAPPTAAAPGAAATATASAVGPGAPVRSGPAAAVVPGAAAWSGAVAAASGATAAAAVVQAGPAARAARAAGAAPARRIGVMISKGGVGKTTTAVSLAAGLAMRGRRVLLVDTDTQGQAAFLLGLNPAKGLAELVGGDAGPEEAVLQARDNLWLLAGGKGLAGIKRLIDRKDFGGEQTLAETLGPLDADYDFIVVDSSPGWDPLTVNVLFYVREILAPLSLEALSLQGLSEFLKSLARVRKYNREVELKYILPTFLDRRVKHPALILDKLRELHGPRLCPPVRYNSKLSEAPAAGRTIFEFAPSSPGAADYRELVRTVLGEGGEGAEQE